MAMNDLNPFPPHGNSNVTRRPPVPYSIRKEGRLAHPLDGTIMNTYLHYIVTSVPQNRRFGLEYFVFTARLEVGIMYQSYLHPANPYPSLSMSVAVSLSAAPSYPWCTPIPVPP